MSLMEPLDLSGPIRTAVLGNTAITDNLGVWQGEPCVFTRRPIPEGALYPLILISQDISVGNADFLVGRLPMPRRDVIVYGQQGAPGQIDDQYRTVEGIAYLLRQQFHRQKFSLDLAPYYSVIEITATGPMSAPVDDDNLVGRAVLLAMKLKDLAT